MDKALKQRLVGAIVLIALAVIVLPMIFGGRTTSDDAGPSQIELPTTPPDLEFETRRFPVGDQPVPESPTVADTTIEQDASAVVSTPPLPVPQPQPSIETPPVEEPVTEIADSGVPSGVEEAQPGQSEQVQAPVSAIRMPPAENVSSLRYVVQVASFGSTQNATRLAGQLEAAGYAVLLDNVASETAQLNRVRVGPYDSEAAAQAVVRELRDQIDGVNPRIVDLKPDQASPAIANDDPLLRWVVQVGSFSSTENARNLVARLRLAGLPSYDDTVTTETSTIYRVRVGPFLDRDEALRAEQQISDDMGIDGVVMSAD